MNGRTRESALWRWLRQGEHFFEDELHWERIENIAGEGTPDVDGHLANSFKLELKSVSLRADGKVDCELKPAQALWLRARWRAGGLCFILVRVAEAGDYRHYLIPGREGNYLMAPIPESQLAQFSIIRGAKPDQLGILQAIREWK